MATSVPPLSVRWLRALGWESSSRFSTGHPLCDSGVRPHLSVLFPPLWDDHATTVQTRPRCVRKRDSDRAGCWRPSCASWGRGAPLTGPAGRMTTTITTVQTYSTVQWDNGSGSAT